MRIEWLGHETFLFTSSLGLKLLTNPFTPGAAFGRLPDKLTTDVLLITSEQPAFNNDAAVENTPTVFRGAVAVGLLNASGIRVRGVATSSEDGRGSNIVFAWSMDGLRICFAGNIQRALTSYEISQIGSTDVLFVPVGVQGALSDEARNVLVSQLRPAVIVPMGSPVAIESWASSWTRVHRLPGNVVFLSADRLSYNPTLLIFGAR